MCKRFQRLLILRHVHAEVLDFLLDHLLQAVYIAAHATPSTAATTATTLASHHHF